MSDNQTQIYSVYINAPAAKVWETITKDTTQWGYGGESEYDLTPGGSYRNLTTDEMKQMGMGEVSVSGTVVEVEEPSRLVLDWSPAWHPESQPTRVTWELTEYPSGLTRVQLTHDLSAAPEYAAEVAGGGEPAEGGGGWPWVLSDLKSLLETGEPMSA